MKDLLLNAYTNLRGWRTRRRLVLFESDDWGATRMQSTAQIESMQSQGLDIGRNPYDRLDCLENQDDLDLLLGVICSFRDSRGRHPTFTFNTVMGNPSFEKIRGSGFSHFYHESLFDSYERYHNENLQPVWNQAIGEMLIKPQFHAREHLNSVLWLKDLSNGRKDTRVAFDHEYYGLATNTSSRYQRHYQAAYWPESAEHLELIKAITTEGLEMFENKFGYSSRSFIACNYVLPSALEATLRDHGVKMIQGHRGQLSPSSDGRKVRVRRAHTGKRNGLDQVYTVRNVIFEPFQDSSIDWVNSALSEIRQSFFFGKPAIISSHRVNYVGGMSLRHRDNSLMQLDKLIRQILELWPDVEFIHSDDLVEVLES